MSSYLLLSCFKYVTVVEEVRLHLVDTARRDKDEVEDGKQSELQVKSPVADHPEGEATEKGGKDVQVDLVPDVVLDLC
jgi:hypothetical protein